MFRKGFKKDSKIRKTLKVVGISIIVVGAIGVILFLVLFFATDNLEKVHFLPFVSLPLILIGAIFTSLGSLIEHEDNNTENSKES